MPDSQFAQEMTPIQTTQATITRDEVSFSPVDVGPGTLLSPAQSPTVGDSEALIRQQEYMIQRQYRLVDNAETVAIDHVYATAYRVSKRVLDFSIASIALLVLAPIMLIVAAMIRLDSPGPALFKQQRVGQGGRLFSIYKFRSMTSNAGVRLYGVHKTESDNRVTRVGRFIRKTSLDELPQLFNVIQGQMSLVGPRPELPEIVLQHYEPWQYRRLTVPQGITGWWQVTGRGKKLLWKHTADDLYYVDRASIWFDIKLLFMTVGAVLGRDGAF